jgi:glycosyltransferase involved in cell wall biosynthesis
VHRVDGPLSVYRGRDDGTDEFIWKINQELADVTVFQSKYSMEKHLELGMAFKAPRVVMNASDPAIFNVRGRVAFDRARKIRLISTSWSSNPRKGAPTYKWIEDHLDWSRFEYTFVGNSPIAFDRIRMIPPVPSRRLAEILRQHDIYVAASQDDPCSNALIEALNCGLPALYLESGGHPEIVQGAGLGFCRADQVPELLDRLVDEYEERQAQVSVPSLTEVTQKYLESMGL